MGQCPALGRLGPLRAWERTLDATSHLVRVWRVARRSLTSARSQIVGALQPFADVCLAEEAGSLEKFEQNSLIAVALDLLIPRPDLIGADVLSPVRRPLFRKSNHLFRESGIFLGKNRVSQFLV